MNAALRSYSNSIKINHTENAKEHIEEAHKVIGIANRLSYELESIFNSWSKVRITDDNLKQLIQLAMVPNEEVLANIKSGDLDELSTAFKNVCDNVYEYTQSDPSQQTETTQGTVFGAYNAITGYFQNVRIYKNEEAKLMSLLFGGTGQLRTQKAFYLCEDFAMKGASIFLN